MSENMKTKIESLQVKAKNLSLLYVEDEDELRLKTSSFLSKIFTNIDLAIDGVEGLEKYTHKHYDLVITDILMPNMNGLEFINKIRQQDTNQEIIIITAYTEFSYLTESIKLGVAGYLIKPLNLLDTLNIIEHSLDKIQAFRDVQMYKTKLEAMVEQRTQEVLELQKQQLINYEYAIKSFVKMMEQRDTYTCGHSERVAQYSKDIAQELGYSKEQCNLIYEAGILHDIGKILTPDSILLKPGKLTKEEYILLQNHVTAGYQILTDVPMYKHLADIVYAHHEFYDGTGYPRSLKGEEIPLFARIMTIADAFDAMTTNRIYKSSKTVPQAIEELQELSGTRYDPNLVPSACKVLQSTTPKSSIDQNPKSKIDDEHFAYFFRDPLTKLYNHNYLDLILKDESEKKNFLCFNMLYIRGFTAYNKKHGWDKGDKFLSAFADYLKNEFQDAKIFRVFGDDFLILKNIHQPLDINKINNSELLVKNKLRCDLKHLERKENNITSYKDLLDT